MGSEDAVGAVGGGVAAALAADAEAAADLTSMWVMAPSPAAIGGTFRVAR